MWTFRIYTLLHIKKHYFIHLCCLFLKSSKAFNVSLILLNCKFFLHSSYQKACFYSLDYGYEWIGIYSFDWFSFLYFWILYYLLSKIVTYFSILVFISFFNFRCSTWAQTRLYNWAWYKRCTLWNWSQSNNISKIQSKVWWIFCNYRRWCPRFTNRLCQGFVWCKLCWNEPNSKHWQKTWIKGGFREVCR